MTIVEHLTELRRRLVISLVAVALAAVVGFVFYEPILDFLKRPYCDVLPPGEPCLLYVQDPIEGFTTRLRIAAFSGLFLASPVVLWQLWRFVTPGLHPKEKRYAIPFIISSIVLFMMGAALAYFTFSRALDFLISVGGGSFQEIYSPARYLRLILFMFLGFGIAFLFPVLLVFLELAGVLGTRQLRKWRRHVAVGVVIAAAIITPSQDPWTLMMLSVPLYLFYEAAILIGRLLRK